MYSKITSDPADFLLKDEKIAYATPPHWVIFSQAVLIILFAFVFFSFAPNIPFYFFGFSVIDIALFFVVLFGVFTAIRAWVYYQRTLYAVTNKRVIMKTGWLQVYSFEIFLDKVEGIFVRQNLAGQLFNYGNIIIVGTGGSQDIFYNVPDPLNFRKAVEQQIDFYRQKI